MTGDRSINLPRAGWLYAAAGVCALGLFASAAHASDGEVVNHLALFEVTSDGLHDDLARQLTQALRQEVLATPGHRLSDARVSVEQLSLVQDCDPEELSCIGKIVRQLGVGGCILGRLQSEGAGAYLELKLFDLSTQSIKRVARATFAQRAISESDVTQRAETLVAQLLGPPPAPEPPVVARAVEAPAPSPAEAAATMETPDDGISGRRVAGYALLGGAALSVGLSVLAFVEIDRSENNENFDKYRRAVGKTSPQVKDVCDEAASDHSHGLDTQSFKEVQEECTTGRTFEVLQFVFLGAAAVSGGLSAYFLLSDDAPSERRPTALMNILPVQPLVRRSGAEVRATFHF